MVALRRFSNAIVPYMCYNEPQCHFFVLSKPSKGFSFLQQEMSIHKLESALSSPDGVDAESFGLSFVADKALHNLLSLMLDQLHILMYKCQRSKCVASGVMPHDEEGLLKPKPQSPEPPVTPLLRIRLVVCSEASWVGNEMQGKKRNGSDRMQT